MHAVVRHGVGVEAGPAVDVADGTLRGRHLGRPRGDGLVELHDPVGAVGAPGRVHREDLRPLSISSRVRASFFQRGWCAPEVAMSAILARSSPRARIKSKRGWEE